MVKRTSLNYWILEVSWKMVRLFVGFSRCVDKISWFRNFMISGAAGALQLFGKFDYSGLNKHTNTHTRKTRGTNIKHKRWHIADVETTTRRIGSQFGRVTSPKFIHFDSPIGTRFSPYFYSGTCGWEFLYNRGVLICEVNNGLLFLYKEIRSVSACALEVGNQGFARLTSNNSNSSASFTPGMRVLPWVIVG